MPLHPLIKARACVQSSAPERPSKIALAVSRKSDGIYAFVVYIRVNLNNKLDKNFVGIPKEPYAFSNNAEGFLGSASFEKTHPLSLRAIQAYLSICRTRPLRLKSSHLGLKFRGAKKN